MTDRPNPACDSLMRVFDGFPPQVRQAIREHEEDIAVLDVFYWLGAGYPPETVIPKIKAGDFNLW